MATNVTVLPHGTYPSGTTSLGPAAIPTGISFAQLSLARSEWVAEVTIKLVVDISLDNGVTWNTPRPDVGSFPIGLTGEGGVALDKNGIPYVNTIIAFPLPVPSSPDRQIRAVLTISGGNLTTTGTLTLS